MLLTFFQLRPASSVLHSPFSVIIQPRLSLNRNKDWGMSFTGTSVQDVPPSRVTSTTPDGRRRFSVTKPQAMPRWGEEKARSLSTRADWSRS